MSDVNIENLPYRPCVGIILFNKEGKVFVGQRLDSPGAWQMPQGGIDDGESAHNAALRELEEEIGTQHVEVLDSTEETLLYDLPTALVPKLWGGKFRGQEQHWIAARFLGQDSEIKLDAHEFIEFSHWQWVDIDHVVDLIVPFKRKVYAQVVNDFKKYAEILKQKSAP